MEFLRLVLYLISPWLIFIFSPYLYALKTWQALILSLFLILPLAIIIFLDYSVGNQPMFSAVFISFLLGGTLLAWLLLSNTRFVVFAIMVNFATMFLFWTVNWQSSPFGPPQKEISKLDENLNYTEVITTIRFGDIKEHYIRRELLGGLLTKDFELVQEEEGGNCLYQGFDDGRNKVLYWNACTNILEEK